MNQNVTLFSDNFDSISKSQLLQAFETLETCATDFFGEKPCIDIDVEYSVGNSTSFSPREFKANFSNRDTFSVINCICHFQKGTHVSFYVSKSIFESNYSYQISATCDGKTRTEVQEFTEAVSEKINTLFKPVFNPPSELPSEQKTQGNAVSENINENSKNKGEQVKKVFKLIGAIVGFLASVATIVSLFFR